MVTPGRAEKPEARRLRSALTLFSTRSSNWPRLQRDPESVSFEYVRAVLDRITWPDCFSRNNVKPHGALSINAFPMGIVLDAKKRRAVDLVLPKNL